MHVKFLLSASACVLISFVGCFLAEIIIGAITAPAAIELLLLLIGSGMNKYLMFFIFVFVSESGFVLASCICGLLVGILLKKNGKLRGLSAAVLIYAFRLFIVESGEDGVSVFSNDFDDIWLSLGSTVAHLADFVLSCVVGAIAGYSGENMRHALGKWRRSDSK